jgi:hypothetical protein
MDVACCSPDTARYAMFSYLGAIMMIYYYSWVRNTDMMTVIAAVVRKR